MRRRPLLALLGFPLVALTIWCVYQEDIRQDVLWVSVPLALLLIWFVSETDDRRFAEVMEAWRKTSGKRKARVFTEGYRTPAVIRTEVKGKAKKVVAPTWELSTMIDIAGGGRQVGVYQLLPKLAYVVAVEADALAGSDFVAVIARLEAKHPELVVRPRVPEDKPSTRTVALRDSRFADRFWIEGADPKGAREMLSEGVREVLTDLGAAWLFVRGDAMALVRYGRVDAADVRALVDAADMIFAEIGADGGPSLTGDDDEEVPAPTASEKASRVAPA
jgi:hypothetical protein